MAKKKRPKKEEVELNLAAMLDMAFQLLTFFILTFKPAPVEGQLELRLPPPAPVLGAKSGSAPGEDEANKEPPKPVESLLISIFPTPTGAIASMGVGEQNIANLPQLEATLRSQLSDQGSPYEQVIIQVGSATRYDELMKVMDVCTRQKMKDGKPLTKLSFVELPEGPGQ